MSTRTHESRRLERTPEIRYPTLTARVDPLTARVDPLTARVDPASGPWPGIATVWMGQLDHGWLSEFGLV